MQGSSIAAYELISSERVQALQQGQHIRCMIYVVQLRTAALAGDAFGYLWRHLVPSAWSSLGSSTARLSLQRSAWHAAGFF